MIKFEFKSEEVKIRKEGKLRCIHCGASPKQNPMPLCLIVKAGQEPIKHQFETEAREVPTLKTSVAILDTEGNVYANGETILSEKDNRSRYKGQYFAVRNALDSCTIRTTQLQLRREIWDAFFQYSRRTRKVKVARKNEVKQRSEASV